MGTRHSSARSVVVEREIARVNGSIGGDISVGLRKRVSSGIDNMGPRKRDRSPGGMVFHVFNRGVARMPLFEKAADYQAFEGVLSAMRCVPNLSWVPRNGDGRVCGVNFTARRRSAPCWQRGRSSARRTASSGSIGPTTRELESLRQSVHRGRPFGRQEWQKPNAKRLGLESAYPPSGRPPKMGRFESGP
jgi:hypothetical protein